MNDEEYKALVIIVGLSGQADADEWCRRWLEQPNKWLDGRKPIDCFTDRSSRSRVYAVAIVEANPPAED